MANTSELEKGLNELKRLTGIALTVTAEDSEQEQLALEQIRCLCLAYREKYNKNDFLMGLMTGGVGMPGMMEGLDGYGSAGYMGGYMGMPGGGYGPYGIGMGYPGGG